MSPQRAEQIRQWHERSYLAARRDGACEQTVDYLGRTVVVPPEVMPATRVARLLGEAVLAEVQAGDLVLDMGTGSGVNAILAASKATRVLAVDVSEEASPRRGPMCRETVFKRGLRSAAVTSFPTSRGFLT
jgi:release factor glutamine methyltransferase